MLLSFVAVSSFYVSFVCFSGANNKLRGDLKFAFLEVPLLYAIGASLLARVLPVVPVVERRISVS